MDVNAKQRVKRFCRRFKICMEMLKAAGGEKTGYLTVLWGYFLTILILPFGAVVFPNRIITQIEEQGSFSAILHLAAAMCLFYAFFRNVQNYCLKNGEARGENLMIFFKMRLNRINMSVPMSRLENAEFQNRREVASQISYNSNYFNGYFYSMARILASLMQIAVILVLVRRLPAGILFFLLLLFFCSMAVSNFYNRKLHAVEQKKAGLQRMMKYLENLIGDYRYGKMIRIHSMGNWLLNLSRGKRKEYVAFREKELDLEYGSKYFSSVLGSIQEFFIYLYLIRMVLEGGISIGEYVLYLAAVHQFSAALNKLADNLTKWLHYGCFAEELICFLKEEETQHRTKSEKPAVTEKAAKENDRDAKKNAAVIESIEFDQVSFRYEKNKNWVLRDLSFVIRKGEKITLVGDNGAGKSTLLSLLLGLYRPTKGRILINGRDTRGIDEESYHKLFAVVFQEYQTYSFNLKENVMLSDDRGQADQPVLEALLQSGFHIHKFEKGLQTCIGKQFQEDGIALSGGEQQKLVMARAVYRKSPVLILDEPTANLSPMAEEQIYQSLYKIAEGRIAIFVSHRLSSARFCDRILVLAGGELLEEGTHAELLKNGKLYREMFQKQASYYEENGHETIFKREGSADEQE